jgi:lipopolysaccharide heptosyltransferase II
LNILLVRLRLIGDVVFTTPIIRALRSRYSDARLVYLVEEAASPVVASNPHLDTVLTVPHSRGWRRFADDWRTAALLRRQRFDLAIDLHGGPRSAWLTWASRAPVRVGYDVPGRAWMYTRRVARPKEFRPRHAVENQWDLLTGLDPAFDRAVNRSKDPVEMPADPELVYQTRNRPALGIPSHHQLTVIHVSAGNPFRRWSESSFAEVAAAVARFAPDSWVVLTAGPSDQVAAERVIAHARERAGQHGVRILGDDGLSLGELRALIEGAALFIGGDSGPLHVASTSAVPIVGLYGPTLPMRSAPWRPESFVNVSIDGGSLPCRPCDQRVCQPGDFRCLTGIAASRVIDAAREVLGRSRPPAIGGPATRAHEDQRSLGARQ